MSRVRSFEEWRGMAERSGYTVTDQEWAAIRVGWRLAMQEVDPLLSELDELREKYAAAVSKYDAAADKVVALAADRDAYREALEAVAMHYRCPPCDIECKYTRYTCPGRIARKALGRER